MTPNQDNPDKTPDAAGAARFKVGDIVRDTNNQMLYEVSYAKGEFVCLLNFRGIVSAKRYELVQPAPDAAALADTKRLQWLAGDGDGEPVIEGLIGSDEDIYDRATDLAIYHQRQDGKPTVSDMLNALRGMIDAAMKVSPATPAPTGGKEDKS